MKKEGKNLEFFSLAASLRAGAWELSLVWFKKKLDFDVEVDVWVKDSAIQFPEYVMNMPQGPWNSLFQSAIYVHHEIICLLLNVRHFVD